MMSNSLTSTRPAPLVSIMRHASQTPSSSSPLHGSKPELDRIGVVATDRHIKVPPLVAVGQETGLSIKQRYQRRGASPQPGRPEGRIAIHSTRSDGRTGIRSRSSPDGARLPRRWQGSQQQSTTLSGAAPHTHS